ncbi:hypothetical protein JL720_15965 [Aureococcus anophagefferens]|nr:hypothetical protein JL720_15965 [Aureococcus anophagefferens]
MKDGERARTLNGDCYRWSWERDAAHGQGTLAYASGDEYVGAWRNNLRHGEGKFSRRWRTRPRRRRGAPAGAAAAPAVRRRRRRGAARPARWRRRRSPPRATTPGPRSSARRRGRRDAARGRVARPCDPSGWDLEPAAGGDPRSYAAADREDRDGWTAAIGDALEGHGRVLAALGQRAPKTPLNHDDAIRRALEAAEPRAKTEPNKKYGPRLYSPFQDPREFL